MSFQCQWRPVCDVCGARGRADISSHDAEAGAFAKGWISVGLHYGGTLHACSECAVKDKPDWWPDVSGESIDPNSGQPAARVG